MIYSNSTIVAPKCLMLVVAIALTPIMPNIPETSLLKPSLTKMILLFVLSLNKPVILAVCLCLR